MSEQTLSNKIGNAVGTRKRRLLDQLKTGEDLQAAVSQFIIDLSHDLAEIVKNVTSPSVAD